MSYQFVFSYGTGVWTILYDRGLLTGQPEREHYLDLMPEGSFTLMAKMLSISDRGAAGVIMTDSEGALVGMLGSWNMGAFQSVPGGEHLYAHQDANHAIDLRLQYDADAGVVRTAYRTTGSWVEVAEVPVATPVHTGLTLIYADETIPVSAYLSDVVQVEGLDDFDAVTEMFAAPSQQSAGNLQPLRVTLTSEPMVYGIIGAPFGDQEFDVGKSVRWMVWFTDKQYILDINYGDPRFWIVNWSITFPSSDHGVTGINYFKRPAEFRKEQFDRADALYKMDPNGWTLWVDGSEGVSFDNSSLPDDYDLVPFKSFVYREIERAEAAGRDHSVLPFFVYLRDGDTQNVTYDHPSNDPTNDIPPVLQPVSVPYYAVANGLKRLIKVSALRDPAFDWSSLDTLVSPSPSVKAQIVSYAYAHWQYPDIPPGNDTVPPINEFSDEGWKMRNKISMVRPVPGIMFDPQPWPGGEPAGVAGPWAVYTLINTNPDFTPLLDEPMPPPAVAAQGIKTPLYDTGFRLNMRDGVWYEAGVSGNTPLAWDAENQKWVTPYDPNLWPDQGVDAPTNPDFVEQPTPLDIRFIKDDVDPLKVTWVMHGAVPGNDYTIVWSTAPYISNTVQADASGTVTDWTIYDAPGTYTTEVYENEPEWKRINTQPLTVP